MVTTGRRPPMAIPAATVTACCSAMPTSKNRSGKRASKGTTRWPGHGGRHRHHPGVPLRRNERRPQ
jgi:hypothetical protein